MPVFFCTSVESGSNKDDLEAFMKFRTLLGEKIRDHMCLVITRRESKTKEQQTTLLDQMRKLEEYRDMLDFFKGGVFFSGALAFDTFNLANSHEIRTERAQSKTRASTNVWAIKSEGSRGIESGARQ